MGWMLFLMPNQQCQSTEDRESVSVYRSLMRRFTASGSW